MPQDRSIPKNKEAEQLVLGSILMDPEDVVPKVIEKVKPGYFYWKEHRLIFRAVLELFDKGDPADVVTVTNRLKEKGQLEEIQGRGYLADLLDKVVTTANLEHYADILRNKALMRALINGGRKISELGYKTDQELKDILDRAEEIVFEISRQETVEDFHLLSDFLREHFDELEELHHDPSQQTISGLSTGFPKLDEMSSGLQDGQLIVIAGRPGTGKTSLALSLVRNIALREDAGVGIFSLEMTKEQLLERLLCGEGKVNLHQLRGGFVPSSKWRDIATTAGKLQESTIVIDDLPGNGILDVKAKARRMKAEHDINFLVVDYLQLIEGEGGADRREQEIAHISRSLKGIARELRIPVVALSQLNRSVERRESKRPRLSDLRESGAIEQDSDLVAFIYREDYYGENESQTDSTVSKTELIIGKQRNGPLGTINLSFHKGYASFYSHRQES
ncbi:replicative DNA helicase [Candidatus Bipolaricaulota bacterium]|nr:replicative DNA helicase [Candidatus Bipolaricaulota bacterium]MBS3814239.1 replicative DNA helicase [Candidatus Bipolaricaulota bacterium]MBS3825326.1 replicative DNA helicase [Candidatus Bipolaricaulota bacterium]